MKKVLLTTLAACIALTGCATTEDINQEKPFEMDHSFVDGKTFVITHLNNKLLPETHNSTFDFIGGEQIAGRSFCNMFIGEYELDSYNNFETEDVVFTEKSCPEIGLAEETILHEILKEDMSFEKTELGFKIVSEKGSFDIMEIQLISKDIQK